MTSPIHRYHVCKEGKKCSYETSETWPHCRPRQLQLPAGRQTPCPCRGNNPGLARGRGGMGWTAGAKGEVEYDGYRRENGREQLLNSDPICVAGGTILWKSNVSHQLELLDIEHHRIVCVECKGFQWRRQASAGAKQPVRGRTCTWAMSRQMPQPELKNHPTLVTS